jgi:ABC-type nitrate/sulfonate/bicarbonate transport system substrate-binding protein
MPHRSRNRSRRSSSRPRIGISNGIVLVAIVMAVFVAGSAYMRGPSEDGVSATGKPAIYSVQLNGPFGSKYAGEIIAARAGLFDREKLRIDLKPGSGADPIESVVSGKSALGVTDSISFLLARSKGQPIVAFAASYLESSVVFYALEKSGIHAPQDFIGKRIGRRADTHSAIIYDALLRDTGLARSQTLETSKEIDLDALLNGKVDVIPGHVGQEAFLLHQKGIAYNVVRISDYGIHVPDTVYVTTEKMIRDYPSVVRRFLEVVIGGWNMTYADTSKSIPLIVAASGNRLTSEQVKFELAAQRDFIKPLGRRATEFDDRQWKQLRNILVNARLIDDSINLSRAINYEFLKEAYRKPISFGN